MKTDDSMGRRHGVRGCAGGFTIVELMVVLAVVTLLVGLLWPALRSVHAASQCTTCLSNLRQVHAAGYQYALTNDDQVPLGYRAAHKQWNSMVYSATVHEFVLFGLLYKQGLIHTPDVFFCPAETDERSMLNSAINPWPPGTDYDPTKHTYCGYGARPTVEIPDNAALLSTVRLPRLTQFENQAILADLTATPDRLDTRHRSGVNALYGDGSAKWIDRARFNDPLQQCPTISEAANDFQDAIWQSLDRR